MDFSFTETQRDIQSIAKKFAQSELAPIVDEDEKNSHFRKELFPKFGSSGLIGITAPEKFGGSGLGTAEYALALEELAYVSSGYAVSFSVTTLPLRIINESGNEEQRKKYLPKLISGEHIGAFCLTEASSGSDPSSLKTTAVREGNHYILNGTKQFITNGMFADTYIVMARTGGAGSKGISAFIVERAFPGVSGGKLEKKMGMRVSPTQEMIFENVKVPIENLIAKEGEGMKVPLQALDGGRISISAIANGLARAAFDKARAYAKEREQFGKKIIDFQGVSFLLSEMASELEASTWLTRYAAFLKDTKQPFTAIASMAKLRATEACMKITTNAVQVLGGYGYIEDYTVERYMREAKMLELVEGTSQIQKIVISRHI